MDREFWKGRRVFLTGHTGFKGSWLSLWLQSMGAEVTGYALAPATDPALFDLARVGEGMKSVIGDIRDLEFLVNAMAASKPEVVIHMAAQPLVRLSYEQPVETYSTNVMGTVHVLEAVRRCSGVRSVVVVTSDKCYENREWSWGYREDDPMGGYDPYSNSKGCSELVVSGYRRSFFNPQHHADHGVALATARAGNVIGGGDWAKDRLVPDILRAMEGGRDVVIRSPHAIRPWQHVLEPLSGYLALAQAQYERGPEFAEAWNFGPWDMDARPVEWIVEQLTSAWGNGAAYRTESGSVHEASYLKLDISKARMRLGWQPRWSLSRCLDNIVLWHRAYLRGDDLRVTTHAQITDYELAAP